MYEAPTPSSARFLSVTRVAVAGGHRTKKGHCYPVYGDKAFYNLLPSPCVMEMALNLCHVNALASSFQAHSYRSMRSSSWTHARDAVDAVRLTAAELPGPMASSTLACTGRRRSKAGQSDLDAPIRLNELFGQRLDRQGRLRYCCGWQIPNLMAAAWRAQCRPSHS